MSYLVSDLLVGRSLHEYGEWAQAELDLLLGLIDVGSVVVDIGAFIGTHTLAFARQVGPEGRVYGFEPHPVAYSLLKVNVDQNELRNVEIFNVALSDTRSVLEVAAATLNNGVENPASFSMPIASEVAQTRMNSFEIQIKCLDQYDIKRCDLMKIDVEGMELSVLKGSTETLQRFRPLVLAECLSVHNGWEVVSFMRDNGFEAFLHNERAFNPRNFRNNTSNSFLGDARETNIVFVSAGRLRALQDRCSGFNSLIPIRTGDDLVLGMLKKPQYKYEALAGTEAARVLGIGFLANEPELIQLETSLHERSSQVQTLESQIHQIEGSIPMQLVSRYQRVVRKLLPTGSRPRYYYELGLTGIRVILNEGWRSFWTRFTQRYRHKHD